MLLNALPETFKNFCLALPRYATAPLGLVNGAQVWVSLHDRHPQLFKELLISPYDPDTWKDLWRMHIQLKDGVGQLRRIVDLLDGNDITILHQTSRDAFKSNYHVKYFMLDCHSYAPPVDQKSDRLSSASKRFQWLELEFLTEFMREIRLSSEGSAWFEIRRNQVHFDMHEALRPDAHGIQQLSAPKPKTIVERQLDVRDFLPEEILKEWRMYYPVITTNAKSQIIYVSLVNKVDHACEHLVIHFDRDNPDGRISMILKEFEAGDLNIIRSQIREGSIGYEKLTKRERDVVDKFNRPFTLNVMILSRKGVRDVFRHVKTDVLEGLIGQRSLIVLRLGRPKFGFWRRQSLWWDQKRKL